MRGFHVVQADKTRSLRSLALLATALTVAVALSGCSTIDNTLFGSAQPAPSQSAAAPPPSSQELTGSSAGGLTGPTSGSDSEATAPTPGTISPVQIAPVEDTGTAVGHTVMALRSDLSAMQNQIMSAAGKLSDLEASNAQFASTYFNDKAQITTHLQLGTTRGNPHLVQKWNAAQSALDSLTVNINALNNLGQQISDISSRAHYMLNTIHATYNVSGAVDEDHRQLDVLDDETNQTIVIIDRLLRQATSDIQRQTAYVATERGSLTTLAAAIQNGQLYGAGVGGVLAAGVSPSSNYVANSTPLVTIRFKHAHIAYKQILYSALQQALKERPEATFSVVAVSPTRGSAPAVQLAQTTAERHARQVLRAMTAMGIPSARLSLSSATDPRVHSTEVRIFVH